MIMEANLSMGLREWYLRAAKPFGWSKAELAEEIAENTHEKIVLAIEDDLCYSVEQENEAVADNDYKAFGVVKKIRHLIQRVKCLWSSKEGNKRRWPIMLCPISMGRRRPQILYERCIHDLARLGEIKKDLPGIANATLSNGLKELEADGFIIRIQFNKIPP